MPRECLSSLLRSSLSVGRASLRFRSSSSHGFGSLGSPSRPDLRYATAWLRASCLGACVPRSDGSTSVVSATLRSIRSPQRGSSPLRSVPAPRLTRRPATAPRLTASATLRLIRLWLLSVRVSVVHSGSGVSPLPLIQRKKNFFFAVGLRPPKKKSFFFF